MISKQMTELYAAMHEYVCMNRLLVWKLNTSRYGLYYEGPSTCARFQYFNGVVKIRIYVDRVATDPHWLYYTTNIFIGTYRQHTYQHASY